MDCNGSHGFALCCAFRPGPRARTVPRVGGRGTGRAGVVRGNVARSWPVDVDAAMSWNARAARGLGCVFHAVWRWWGILSRKGNSGCQTRSLARLPGEGENKDATSSMWTCGVPEVVDFPNSIFTVHSFPIQRTIRPDKPYPSRVHAARCSFSWKTSVVLCLSLASFCNAYRRLPSCSSLTRVSARMLTVVRNSDAWVSKNKDGWGLFFVDGLVKRPT
jgi:hypothetical protein